jgi:hypothetical protein
MDLLDMGLGFGALGPDCFIMLGEKAFGASLDLSTKAEIDFS